MEKDAFFAMAVCPAQASQKETGGLPGDARAGDP